jgi:hypothetical protein
MLAVGIRSHGSSLPQSYTCVSITFFVPNYPHFAVFPSCGTRPWALCYITKLVITLMLLSDPHMAVGIYCGKLEQETVQSVSSIHYWYLRPFFYALRVGHPIISWLQRKITFTPRSPA